MPSHVYSNKTCPLMNTHYIACVMAHPVCWNQWQFYRFGRYDLCLVRMTVICTCANCNPTLAYCLFLKLLACIIFLFQSPGDTSSKFDESWPTSERPSTIESPGDVRDLSSSSANTSHTPQPGSLQGNCYFSFQQPHLCTHKYHNLTLQTLFNGPSLNGINCRNL